MSKRSPKLLVQDILESGQKILIYTEGLSFEEFANDSKTIDAVIRNFEIIGEAAKNLSAEIKDKYPDVPWAEMYLMRNKISHEYFGIDYEIIWHVATNDLPENKKQIENILLLEE